MIRNKLCWGVALLLVVVAGWSASAQVGYQAAPVQQQPQAYYPGQGGGGQEFFSPKLGVYFRLVPYNPYGGGGGGGGGGGFTTAQGNYDPNNPPGSGYAYQAPMQQAPVSYGARLSRYPVAGSPCANLQLEPGDMFVSLDNLPFHNAQDVLAHYGQTTAVFINVRTGLPQQAYLELPY